jgi:hypothetical protein
MDGVGVIVPEGVKFGLLGGVKVIVDEVVEVVVGVSVGVRVIIKR